MAKCPKCGADVARERKSWKMAGRPDRTAKRTELTIGLFDCPKCKKTFRVVLDRRCRYGGPIDDPDRPPKGSRRKR